MTPADKIQQFQKGTYGFIMNFKTGANMTTTTSLKVRIRKPKANTIIEHSIPVGNIVDPFTGSVNYIVEENVLDVKGKYKIQILDDTPGRYLLSKPVEFLVVANI